VSVDRSLRGLADRSLKAFKAGSLLISASSGIPFFIHFLAQQLENIIKKQYKYDKR
jgi:hypothetical protein